MMRDSLKLAIEKYIPDTQKCKTKLMLKLSEMSANVKNIFSY